MTRRASPEPMVYLPGVSLSPAYVVRSSRAEVLAPEVRAIIREFIPESPMYRIFTMKRLAANAMAGLSFTMLMVTIAAVLGRAIAQIPAQHRRHLLIRADGAGATHQLLDWLAGLNQLRGRRVEYSVGFPTKNTAVTSAIARLPAKVWTPAVTAVASCGRRSSSSRQRCSSTL